MAADFDGPPIYDALFKEGSFNMSDIWIAWISTHLQSLIGYLASYGIFIPVLTLAQQASIQVPQEGQVVYISDFTAGPPRTAAIQVWQVKSGIGAWRTITTTP